MSIESVAILGAIRKARQGKRYGINIDNMKIIDELDRRADIEGKTRTRYVCDLLWDVLFPGEPNPTDIQANTKELVKICPECSSQHILEPNRGFNLNWECRDCRAEFIEPAWAEEKQAIRQYNTRIIEACPVCGVSRCKIRNPSRSHPGKYYCTQCHAEFEQLATRESCTGRTGRVRRHV